jgi:hypothetical protein
MLIPPASCIDADSAPNIGERGVENQEIDANPGTESASRYPGRENRPGSIGRLMTETGIVADSS